MPQAAAWQVLVIDNSSMFRDLLCGHLRARFPGIELLEAANVAEGYFLLNEHRPALAFLDVSLPDGNGLQLARRARVAFPEVNLCICTGHDFPEYRKAAAESGAAFFISKHGPFWSEGERIVEAVFGSADADQAPPAKMRDDAASECNGCCGGEGNGYSS
jgi:DNA-binding NarL/FixJ family response regulator